jgi:hypothetical protein
MSSFRAEGEKKRSLASPSPACSRTLPKTPRSLRRVVYLSIQLTSPVRRGATALNRTDLDEPNLAVDIKQNPPVADAAAKGGVLTGQPDDVAGERIGLHLLDRRPKALLVRAWRARHALLSALSEQDGPGV